MTASLHPPVSLIITAIVWFSGWEWLALPDLYGIFRTVMMVLGGLVVVAIMLIVAVAIISGVMGMVGRLRKKA